MHTCYHCGGSLEGRNTTEYTDPMGHSHPMHASCYEKGNYGEAEFTAAPVGEDLGEGSYIRKGGYRE